MGWQDLGLRSNGARFVADGADGAEIGGQGKLLVTASVLTRGTGSESAMPTSAG